MLYGHWIDFETMLYVGWDASNQTVSSQIWKVITFWFFCFSYRQQLILDWRQLFSHKLMVSDQVYKNWKSKKFFLSFPKFHTTLIGLNFARLNSVRLNFGSQKTCENFGFNFASQQMKNCMDLISWTSLKTAEICNFWAQIESFSLLAALLCIVYKILIFDLIRIILYNGNLL